jgi:hypothetical protein
MRHCMMTDVVYSKIRGRFENYERNTGRRHPMLPEVDSPGSWRASVPLIDENAEQTDKLWHGIVARLRR